MSKLDDELAGLARSLTPKVDPDETLESVRRRVAGGRRGFPVAKVLTVAAAALIAIAAFFPLSRAFRSSGTAGKSSSPTTSASPTPFVFSGTLAMISYDAREQRTGHFWTPAGCKCGGPQPHLYTFTGSGRPTLIPEVRSPSLPNAGELESGLFSWSPDGSHVVVNAQEPDAWWYPGSAPDTVLLVVDVPSGKETYLDEGTLGASGAAWSPDGKEIAYIYGSEIYIVHPDGSGRKMLQGIPKHDYYDLGWSPDGRELALTYGDSSAEGGVYVVGVNGSDPRLIVTDPNAGDVIWSPDGKTLTYIDGNGQAELVGVDGGARRVLYPGHSSSRQAVSCAWSPAGNAIAVVVGYPNDNPAMHWPPRPGKVYIVDLSGRVIETVNTTGLDVSDVAWSPRS
jgi:Tol biopolymer transport system component